MTQESELQKDDRRNAGLLASRLSALANRVEYGDCPNPTALLCIRNAKLSAGARLQYRAIQIANIIDCHRETYASHILNLFENAYVLIVARQGGLADSYLARNRQLGAEIAQRLFRLQPGSERLSHYCSRRTGSNADLLAVEFFARSLEWAYIDGTEDYLAAMYRICRQPNLRYKFLPNAAPKLWQLASNWLEVAHSVR